MDPRQREERSGRGTSSIGAAAKNTGVEETGPRRPRFRCGVGFGIEKKSPGLQGFPSFLPQPDYLQHVLPGHTRNPFDTCGSLLFQEYLHKTIQLDYGRKAKDKFSQTERRTSRLMKELGLSSKGVRPRLNSANDRQYQYYPNKLKRQFFTDAPNKVWVSDITYAKVGMDFVYLCVIIDLYSRKVISYTISENMDTALVIDTFQQAFLLRGNPAGVLFHSDQGTQYTSFQFRKLLKQNGVTQSFSAPGSPYDNAVAESFFASIKKEDFRRNYYPTFDQFQTAVDAYIEFYNDYRPHQRLGQLTPNQAEAEYQAAKSI